MRTIKTLKKQMEAANRGVLLYIEDGAYHKATQDTVLLSHGKRQFFIRNTRRNTRKVA